VTVTVTDDDGGVGSDSFIASVAPLDEQPEDPEDPEDPDEPEDSDDPVGGEGCSPGFWSRRADVARFPSAWPSTGYNPSGDLDAEFEVVPPYTTHMTLLDAQNSRSGGLNALARQAVAALLNSAHPGIDFDLNVDEVRTAFLTALESGDFKPAEKLLKDLNDQGCPIDGK
jgi:hypothetical protein